MVAKCVNAQVVARSILKKVSIPACLALSTGFASAQAGEVFNYQTRGSEVNLFGSGAPDDCVSETINVFASEYVTRSNGSGKSGPGGPLATVFISSYDFCTYRFSYGYVDVTPSHFSVERKLGAASLVGTGDITIYTDSFSGDEWTSTSETRTLNMDLLFTGTGTNLGGRYHDSHSGPGYMYRSMSNGDYREATVTGTLNDGENDYLGGANQYLYAQLGRSSSHTISMSKSDGHAH